MAKSTLDALAFLRKHLEGEGGSDLLREMIKAFAENLTSAKLVRTAWPLDACEGVA